MSFQVEDIQNLIAYWEQTDIHERMPQIVHRMELVQMWNPAIGAQILEIGCGQGDTTIVLAVAAGEPGSVLAIDKASPDYGSPSIGSIHARILSSPLGKRIVFKTSTDILEKTNNFPENHFDLVVLSHSSWYLDEPEDLYRIFQRVRPWAKRLGYAEWDIVHHNDLQLPHFLAVILQANLKALDPHIKTRNIRSLITPSDAHRMAYEADWRITLEKRLNTSTMLWDGNFSEIYHAKEMANEFLRNTSTGISSYTKSFVKSQLQILSDLAVENRGISLSTYAFLAE